MATLEVRAEVMKLAHRLGVEQRRAVLPRAALRRRRARAAPGRHRRAVRERPALRARRARRPDPAGRHDGVDRPASVRRAAVRPGRRPARHTARDRPRAADAAALPRRSGHRARPAPRPRDHLRPAARAHRQGRRRAHRAPGVHRHGALRRQHDRRGHPGGVRRHRRPDAAADLLLRRGEGSPRPRRRPAGDRARAQRDPRRQRRGPVAAGARPAHPRVAAARRARSPTWPPRRTTTSWRGWWRRPAARTCGAPCCR